MRTRLTGMMALGTLLADQAFKAWLKDADRVLIPGLARLYGIRNTGVSFGLMAGQPELVTLMTMALILLAALFLRRHPLGMASALGAGLMLGGALGNLADRLIYGAVVDYVKLTFIDFPVFNLADACIILGAALLVIGALLDQEGRAA